MTPVPQQAPTPAPGPRISAVITTYNQRQYVLRAIRSALEQTLPPTEVIVVDDGSTDGTGETVRREFGDRVRYHFQQNRGPSAARNAGVRLSSGEWIAFLDGDDHWAPEKLELQVAALGEHPQAALVGCGALILGQGDEKQRFSDPPRSLIRRDIYKRVSMRNLFPMGVLVRKDIFVQLGGFDEDLRCGEDREMWARIAAHHEVTAVRRPLLIVTYPAHSVSHDPVPVLRDGLIVNRRVQELLGRRSWPGRWLNRLTLRRADAKVYRSAAYLHADRHETPAAARAMMSALVRWPFSSPANYWFTIRIWMRFLFGGRPQYPGARQPER